MPINILEIRNYLLKPDMLEHYIDYFEEHFIFAQQDLQLQILGQFRVTGEPDHFVWLRGFSDMQARHKGLQNFYDSPVWTKYGDVAFGMLLDFSNVHLLRPLDKSADLTSSVKPDSIAADLAAGTISPATGMVMIDFYKAMPGKRDELIDKFQSQVIPIYQQEAIQVRGTFVAEMSENEPPTQAAIQDEDEWVVITAYENRMVCREKREKVEPQVQEIIGSLLSTPLESLLLSPTLRSPLRYLPT